jgi:hypothetical protein
VPNVRTAVDFLQTHVESSRLRVHTIAIISHIRQRRMVGLREDPVQQTEDCGTSYQTLSPRPNQRKCSQASFFGRRLKSFAALSRPGLPRAQEVFMDWEQWEANTPVTALSITFSAREWIQSFQYFLTTINSEACRGFFRPLRNKHPAYIYSIFSTPKPQVLTNPHQITEET